MALSEAQLALVTVLRKEMEDVIKKQFRTIYSVQYIQQDLVFGNNSIAIPYESADETYEDTSYIIDIISAVVDGVDVKDELEILEANKTVNGFVVNALQPVTSARFVTMRKTPQVDYFTDD